MLYTLKRRFARSYSIYAINLEWGCPYSPPITHTAFHNVLAANEAAHLLKSLSDDYRALFGPPRVSLRHRAKRVHPNPNHRGFPPVPPTNGCRLGGWHLGHSPCNGCLRPAAAKPSSEWCNNNCDGPSPPPLIAYWWAVITRFAKRVSIGQTLFGWLLEEWFQWKKQYVIYFTIYW